VSRIDSHHHLWHYEPAAYPWITDATPLLQRDYDVADLLAALAGTGVDGTVAVQAQQAVEETEWLLALAREHPIVRGVVGWVPLVEADVEAHLDRLSADTRLKGIRHIVHDEPDDAFVLRSDFNRGVAALERYGLVYDVLIFARHLRNALAFVDRHPRQPFVVDHIAKPVIRAGRFDDEWARGLRLLAERPHVTCKLSGVVTEVRDPHWSIDLIRPYVDVALEAFGPSRLMFGTDWPVCRLRAEYQGWVQAVERLFAPLSADEQAQVWSGTATRVYALTGA
jgi:L-fuconolactonase